MSPSPLVSIVSASWNQGEYLQECINSLTCDFSHQIEHIIIDNCSDDETKKVLDENPDIIKIIEPDHGQSNALNKGFRAARGEWVLWLNVDDFLSPGALSAMIKLLEKDGSNLDVIYGHMVFVDANSRRIKRVYQAAWRYWMTAKGIYCAPSTGSLYRRKLLIENPLDEDFHMIMDTEWMLRCGKALRVKRLNRETVCFRVADNKTADHINTGHLSARHIEERRILASRYPEYGRWAGKQEGVWPTIKIALIRKLIRIRILADKAWCHLISKLGCSEG